MYKIPLLSFLALAIFGLFSCESDLISNRLLDDDASGIESRNRDNERTCVPGTIQTDRNLIQFANSEAFVQTLHFFSCATPDQKDVWRNSHPIETSQKAYLAFREDAAYDKVHSETELFNIENQYDGKITVNIDEVAAERSYEVEYPILSDFVDVDGVFMVGNDMIRLIDDRMITVKNGIKDEVMKLDKDVDVTDNDPPNDGDVIGNNTTIVRGGPGCCPDEQFIQKTYNSNGLRKIFGNYRLFATYTSDSENTSSNDALLNLSWGMKAEKRKTFLFWKYWADDNATSITTEIAVKGTYSYGFGTELIEGDILWPPDTDQFDETFVKTKFNTSYMETFTSLENYDYEEEGLPKESVYETCLDEVFFLISNDEQNQEVSYECGEEIDLPAPVIIFYEDNDGEGEVVCEIVLDPAVGYLNFKNYSPCSNDEARSAKLLHMRQGMRLRVFDNPDMETSDDWALINIKQDFDSETINTFEKNENEPNYRITFFKDDGGLDGKISSFIDN